MSNQFTIQGLHGAPLLSGEVAISGAKNAVLKGFVASLLCDKPVLYTHVPEIEDITRMIELLSAIGVVVEKDTAGYRIDATALSSDTLPSKSAQAMRASIVLVGPLLARMKRVVFPNPGGCNLGERPIDLFLEGLSAMGAEIEETNDSFILTAPQELQGIDFFFRVQSHTATEMFMMTAVLAHGTTILKNVALEPEVKHLADFLNARGAKIHGAGTSTITIEGNGALLPGDASYQTMSDRIEAGSLMILGALLAKELVIKDVVSEHNAMLSALLRRAGVSIEEEENRMIVRGGRKYTAIPARTHEYPGLPTDIQAPLVVFMTQAEGESTLFETIFEGRLNYTHALNEAGADIKLFDTHRAHIFGKKVLHGHTYTAPDLRAGFAFVLAGLIADGESVIQDVNYIDRGYECIDERLRGLGISIERT